MKARRGTPIAALRPSPAIRAVQGLLLSVATSMASAQAPATTSGAEPAPPPVLIDRFTYTVDGLKIKAVTCREDRKVNRPLLNIVHGGLNSPVDEKSCERFARLGYVVAASALRGQGGSEGKPEVCSGEARDVLTLRRIAQQKYQTNPRRVAYLGVSLGGCIAIKAAAQDRDVRAVVTLVSPTDFAQQLELLRATRPDAVQRWEQLLGGPPTQVPAAYRKRQPLAAAAKLDAPLLTIAAGNDPLIPVRQSCAVRDAREAAGRHVHVVRQNQDGTPGAPPAKPWRQCERENPSGTLPPLRHQDVLLIYGDLGHTSTPRMWSVAQEYLSANIKPPTLLERLRQFLRQAP